MGHVDHMKEKRNAFKFLVEKAEGKRPLERPRCGRMDNKINMKEITR
jgi:hypothetical protein